MWMLHFDVPYYKKLKVSVVNVVNQMFVNFPTHIFTYISYYMPLTCSWLKPSLNSRLLDKIHPKVHIKRSVKKQLGNLYCDISFITLDNISYDKFLEMKGQVVTSLNNLRHVLGWIARNLYVSRPLPSKFQTLNFITATRKT